LLVFANKQDIQGSMTDKEIQQASSADLLDQGGSGLTWVFFKVLDLSGIKSHQWCIVSCSAVTGYNLLEGLNWVVGEVASRLYYSTFTEGATSTVTVPPVLTTPPTDVS
jgi:ADP-ribosylation factor-like protein 2